MFRKIFIFISFFFCTINTFSQEMSFLWSTISAPGVRVIPMTSVREQVMNLYNRYSFHTFERGRDGNFFINRIEHRNIMASLYNMSLNDPRADKLLQQRQWQIISWYDTNRNFVYAWNIGDGMITVAFVTRNTIMEVTFGNRNLQDWYPTRDAGNRRLFEDDLDWLLARM